MTDVVYPHERRMHMLADLRLLPMQYVPDAAMPSVVDASGSSDPASLVRHVVLQDVLRDGRRFVETYAMTVAEFVILHARLQPGINSVRQNSRGTGIDHAHSHALLTSAEQLIVWLEYIKGARNASERLLLSGLDRTTIDRYVDHVTGAVNGTFERLIQWPDAAERANLHDSFGVATGVIGVLDGTHCEIDKPKHDAQLYCAGQKKDLQPKLSRRGERVRHSNLHQRPVAGLGERPHGVERLQSLH